MICNVDIQYDIHNYFLTLDDDKSATVSTLTPIPETGSPTGPLDITNDNDCNKLYQHTWTSITIGEGLCKSLKGDLVIDYYPHLTSINIGWNSLTEVGSLLIEKNKKLEKIVVNDKGTTDSSPTKHALRHAESVIIRSI